jgi:protein-S-isoprenylcysteine O-methyltransferase Ste14
MPDEKDRAGVIAPPPLIFLAFLILGWLLARKLLPPFEVPYGVVIGAVLVVAALAFAIWARSIMVAARTNINPFKPTTAIVSTGPFRWTRNPLYLSMSVIYIGLALLLHAAAAILLLPVVLIIVTFGVIRREEAYLERKFGTPYREYRGRVRRWL